MFYVLTSAYFANYVYNPTIERPYFWKLRSAKCFDLNGWNIDN